MKPERTEQSRKTAEQPKESAGITLGSEAADLLLEVLRHSKPHPSVPFASSLAADLLEKLAAVLRAKNGLDIEVE